MINVAIVAMQPWKQCWHRFGHRYARVAQFGAEWVRFSMQM
jgi:hypothetical protein